MIFIVRVSDGERLSYSHKIFIDVKIFDSMKKIVLVLFAVVAMACCRKEENPLDITGEWRLSGIETKVSIWEETVDVYLSFSADRSFMMYQMIGAGRYRAYSGSWFLSGNTLSGIYSDGRPWGAASYEVEMEGNVLTLMAMDASGRELESDTYTRTSIPADVRDGAVAHASVLSPDVLLQHRLPGVRGGGIL